MIGRIWVMTGLLGLTLGADLARAQDVPGIEICTVEKTMERRTSCLQSNVDFLIKTISKLGRDQQQKLDAANRQIEALKASLVGLQSTVDELKAAQKKTDSAPTPAPAKDQPSKTPANAEPTKDGAK
ncbi:hypothetical protein [Rhodopseudomonas palustris]|uniref:Uncharacterized protein n=1 Tax=Rhodopseudomonas palustris (strain BisB18) TaxID=316056 RepID=Q210J1_RHOPB